MSFSRDLNFGDWVFKLAENANTLLDAVKHGEVTYQKFEKVMYGKTDAEIIALPGFETRTVDDIIALRYALGAMHGLYLALYNGAVTQRDRMGDLIPFL